MREKFKSKLCRGFILLMLVMLYLTGCGSTNNQLREPEDKPVIEQADLDGSIQFTKDKYVYSGVIFTERQRMASDFYFYIPMIEKIMSAVINSEGSVDLSEDSNLAAVRNGAIQWARMLDPLTEVVEFIEDNEKDGLYHINYGCTIEEHKDIVTAFKEKVESIVNECKKGAESEQDYAKALFDYMVKYCKYDFSVYHDLTGYHDESTRGAITKYTLSAFDTIMTGNGVCNEFSRAYAFLLRAGGVEAITVYSLNDAIYESNNTHYNGRGEKELFGSLIDEHAWNLMKINGKWYGADITFANSYYKYYDLPDMIDRYFGMNREREQNNYPGGEYSVAPGYNISDIVLSEENLIPIKDEEYEQGSYIDDKLKVESINVEYTVVEANPEIGQISFMRSEGLLSRLFEFIDSGNTYKVTAFLPEGYSLNDMKEINVCYYLDSPSVMEKFARYMKNPLFTDKPDASSVKEAILSDEELQDTIVVCIESVDINKGFAQPGIFLNECINGIVKYMEEEINLITVRRSIVSCNFSMFALFQSDGITKDLFNSYISICPQPNIWFGNQSMSTYELEFFRRCNGADASVMIIEEYDREDRRAVQLFAEKIKKREYENMEFLYLEAEPEVQEATE